MKLFLPKEIYTEFQHINHEIGQLLKEAYSLRENVERLPGNDRDTEIKGKLASLHSKLNEYSKQARTRETLSSALISEEEQLRTKLAAMEEEQVCFNISCICVSRQLNYVWEVVVNQNYLYSLSRFSQGHVWGCPHLVLGTSAWVPTQNGVVFTP